MIDTLTTRRPRKTGQMNMNDALLSEQIALLIKILVTAALSAVTFGCTGDLTLAMLVTVAYATSFACRTLIRTNEVH